MKVECVAFEVQVKKHKALLLGGGRHIPDKEKGEQWWSFTES